jgi:hypothetical protein
MNPTVMAAAIGVGGTVIVGIAGFWASVRTTSKTIRDGHDTRVWDQRRAIYVEILVAVYYRNTRRDYDTGVYSSV